jgi:hypothetical protein
MPLRRALLFLLLGFIPARSSGQRAVAEYTPAPRYATFSLGVQVTGDPDRGREVMAAWGRMLALGGGAWMPWLELAGGVSPGNRDVIEGVAMGPRLTLARAFPSQYVGFGRSRGEPYLLATAAMYGAGDFGGGSRWGGAPALSAGFGFRIFRDQWNVDLSTFEVVVERRFGVQNVRIGTAQARHDGRDRTPPAALTGG